MVEEKRALFTDRSMLPDLNLNLSFRTRITFLVPLFFISVLLSIISDSPTLVPKTENVNMAAVALEVVTVLPSIAHTATVIFIHGLGDSGYGWRPVAEVRGAIGTYIVHYPTEHQASGVDAQA
jgi:pimeloyl-ACP methyl ester carboxylesterase